MTRPRLPLLAALALLIPGSSSRAQKTDAVTRGPLTVTVKTQGTVRSEDIFRIRASIEGRVESIKAKPLTWATPRTELGTLLTSELAAMMDARATTPSQTLEDRWQRVYKPTPLHCPQLCFILKVYAQEGKIVKPNALLMEAAQKLRLVGRVRPGDAQWIEKGQLVTYWPKADPKKKVQSRIESFVLDVQGESVEPGGTFTILLDSRHYLDPGTDWEGEITVLAKKNVLRVPTEALLHHNGETFLPVRVSTGVTSYGTTEIMAGVGERTRFLQLDTSERTDVPRHSPLGPPPSEIPPQEEPAARPARRRERRQQERPTPRTRPSPRRSRPYRRGESEPFKIKRIKRTPGEIDVFPDEAEVQDDERFPSDNE